MSQHSLKSMKNGRESIYSNTDVNSSTHKKIILDKYNRLKSHSNQKQKSEAENIRRETEDIERN